jgi:hypothetical protein
VPRFYSTPWSNAGEQYRDPLFGLFAELQVGGNRKFTLAGSLGWRNVGDQKEIEMNTLRVYRLFTGLSPFLAAGSRLLAIGAIAVALAPQVLPAQDSQCRLGNATMDGTYVASGTGTVVGVGPIAVVGTIVYNGDGTGKVVSITRSVNGISSTSTGIPATFTVKPDCTGTKNVGGTNYNFVITPDGRTITWIVTDAGLTLMGTGVRLR